MSKPFDEALFSRSTPWAACAALEEFFAAGKSCALSDSTNWAGIVSKCASRAQEPNASSQQPDVFEALGWSHLAIIIRESLAKDYGEGKEVGTIIGAMWARVAMIARCGCHPGDHICDCGHIVDWCLRLPEVKEALKMTTIPEICGIDPNARGVAQILEALISDGNLERKGDVERLLNLIDQAKLRSKVGD